MFTNFKILLINGSFNFTAFICVVGQKKRSCVAASLCGSYTSRWHYIPVSFVVFCEFLGSWLGLKSCNPDVQFGRFLNQLSNVIMASSAIVPLCPYCL